MTEHVLVSIGTLIGLKVSIIRGLLIFEVLLRSPQGPQGSQGSKQPFWDTSEGPCQIQVWLCRSLKHENTAPKLGSKSQFIGFIRHYFWGQQRGPEEVSSLFFSFSLSFSLLLFYYFFFSLAYFISFSHSFFLFFFFLSFSFPFSSFFLVVHPASAGPLKARGPGLKPI